MISKLPNTSPGPDMIHAIFIKNLNQTWKKSLLNIINQAWSEGIYPGLWKKGEAIMVLKIGKDCSKLDNHRFITLLPILGKVMERMVKKRLDHEIEKRLLHKNIQCGFRKEKNAIDCLTLLKNSAVYALQNKMYMIAILLDVKGAFDSIVHR